MFTVPDKPARLRLANALASAAVVALACALFELNPLNEGGLLRTYTAGPLAIGGRAWLWGAAAAYAVAAMAWMLAQRAPSPCKSLRCWVWLAAAARAPRMALRGPLAPADRLALLATLLKAFFAPLMALSLMSFCMAAANNLQGLAADPGLLAAPWRELFDRVGFWLLLQTILFVDVLVFTVGYLVESPRLGNEIRSVDPTLLGWAAALLCYPPFNQISGAVLGAQHTDFPRFDDPLLHATLNGLLLLLMAAYASASWALGWKASNLTHRGIVSRGPYAVVRHPAYACKSLAWWIGAVPLVGLGFGQSWLQGLQALAAVAGWTLLYLLRALTEEDHLRKVDGDYARYAQRVRWRFFPGLH